MTARYPHRVLVIPLLVWSLGATALLADELWPTGFIPVWEQGLPGARTGSQRNVDVVWAGSEFAMVWDSDPSGIGDIELLFVSPSGESPGGVIPVSQAAGDQKRPAAVRVGERVFVLWEDSRNSIDQNKGDLFATFVSADGSVSPPNGFAIGETDAQQRDVEVAATAGVILAVWEERSFDPMTGFGPTTLMGQRLELDGDPIDDPPFAIGGGVEPTVATDGDRFLVAYQGGGQAISGQFVSGDPAMAPLVGGEIGLASGGNGVDEPSLAFGEGRYALSWIQEVRGSPEEQLIAQRFDDQGIPLESEGSIFLVGIDEDAEHEIAWAGDGFVIAARLGAAECAVAEIDWTGEVVFEMVSLQNNEVQDPAIAASPTGDLLVAWEDEVWESSQVNGENLFYASRPAGGSFGAPAFVGEEGGGYGFVDAPAGAGVPGGAFIVAAFRGYSGRADEIHVTRLGRDPDWSFESRLVDTMEADYVWAFPTGDDVLLAWWSADRRRFGLISGDEVFGEPLPVPERQFFGATIFRDFIAGASGQPVQLGHDGDVMVACAAVDYGRFAGVGILAKVIDPAPSENSYHEILPAGPYAYSLVNMVGDDGRYLLIYQRSNGESLELFAQRLWLDAANDEVGPLGDPVPLAPSVSFGSINSRDSALIWPEGVEVAFRVGGDLRVAWVPWDPAEDASVESVQIASSPQSGVLLSRRGDRTVGQYTFSNGRVAQLGWQRGSAAVAELECVSDVGLSFLYTDHVALPDPAESLFVGFASAQALVRDRPRIDALRTQDLGDGITGLSVEVSGPAFGTMTLQTATDLANWLYARPPGGSVPSVELDASGRGVLSGEFPLTAKDQFWRADYRP